jgi:predicted phosphodiesterase
LAKQYGVARSTLQSFIKNHLGTISARMHGDRLEESPDTHLAEIPTVVRDYRDRDELYLYPLGDVHIGAPHHAASRWQEWLNYLLTAENAAMVGVGDFLNAGLKDSKSEAYDELLRVGQARDLLWDQLTPLAQAGRLDLLMPGNHEDRIYRAVGDCPIQVVAKALNVPYVREAVLMIYNVGKVSYEVYVRHGTGGGEIGARANRLAKQARTLVADVYISGHSHSQLVFQQDLFVAKAGRVERRRQLFVSSGSFVGYEGYAAKRGYAPTKIGAPRIRLDGTRLDAHASI